MKAPPLLLRAPRATEVAAEELFAREPKTGMYVPRRATEEVLRRLVLEIEADTPLMLLSGPAGIGKSLILRKLAETAQARVRCVELSARRAGLDAIRDAVRAALQEEADRTNRVPNFSLALPGLVLLLLDDAEWLPSGGVAGLLELALEGKGRLQILVAGRATPGARAGPRSLAPGMAWTQLVEPMSLRETLRYVRARLELAVASPELRRRFGPVAVARLWRESAGNPAKLHELARRRIGLERSGTPVVAEAPLDPDELSAFGLGDLHPANDRVQVPSAPQPPDPLEAPAAPADPEPLPPRLRIVADAKAGRGIAADLRRRVASEAARAARTAARVDVVARDPGSGAPAAQARTASPDSCHREERSGRRLTFDGAVSPVHEPRDPPDWLDDAIALRLLDQQTMLALTRPRIPLPPPPVMAQSGHPQDTRDRVTAISAALMFISLSAFLFVLLVVSIDTLSAFDYTDVRSHVLRYLRD